MEEFNPPNTYRWKMIDYHGKQCIHIQHKTERTLSFVYQPEMSLADVQASIKIMEENFKRHA